MWAEKGGLSPFCWESLLFKGQGWGLVEKKAPGKLARVG